jgi:hypothetical protein
MMKKAKKRQQNKHLPRFALQRILGEVNSTPLDRALFMELIEIAIEALSGRRLALPPDSERCLEDLKGSPGKLTLCFTGIPENQMMFSIRNECRCRFGKKKSEMIFHSFMWRWWAICDAKRKGILDEFIRTSRNKQEQINNAVFHAAAECSLNAKTEFSKKEYLIRIREIICGEDTKN